MVVMVEVVVVIVEVVVVIVAVVHCMTFAKDVVAFFVVDDVFIPTKIDFEIDDREILKNALETDFHIKIIPHQPILIVNKTSQRSIEDITTYQIDASEKENQYFGFFLRARKCWLIYEAMIGRPGTRTGEKTSRVFSAEHPSLRFLL